LLRADDRRCGCTEASVIRKSFYNVNVETAIVEYVVACQLLHLHARRHGREFRSRLAVAMRNY